MIGENNIGKISSVESGRCNSYVIDLCSAVAKFDLQKKNVIPEWKILQTFKFPY